jgi:phage FluMu protein Com
MGNFIKTQAYEGAKPFRCFKCNKQLLMDVTGVCTIKLSCPRCKTVFVMEVADQLPNELAVRAGILTKQ